MSDEPEARDSNRDDRLIVVVGPCASGKSTLVDGLRTLQYRAMVSGQEHSEIPSLWKRSRPDVTIGLVVDLATIRSRRSPEWSEAIYQRQQARLRDAYAASDLLIDTRDLDPKATLAAVVELLDRDVPAK